ncbi:MAG TPA: replicative DNA helicase [Elusimicrobia bacterium]|nr:MAG: replicative DNA helicase [Elusimicrobia bacterium GWA2_66_18]OGR69731.1 MAG: replicative DNA helicase [Elusimicrobia bacterium GWC2_65_9]HAZ09108.1 replicative DNA helicase [Elusimicrobiota bacterium]
MAPNPAQPPQALEAEMAVLGSMLIEREAAEKAIDVLHESDFYLDAHKRVFKAIHSLFSAGQAVDVVTISEELRKRSELDVLGGGAYLADLINKVTTAAHVEHYADLVKEKAILRDLINAATGVVTACYTQEKNPKQILDEAQGSILKVSERQTLHGVIETQALVHEVIEQIEKAHHSKQAVTGIPTGLTAFDKMTTGFQSSDLILIAARPSQGKTALAQNIVAHVVLEKNLPVLFFSLEMNRHAIMHRFIAAEAKVNLKDIRTGFFRRDRWQDLTTAAARFAESPLFINDNPGMTVFSVRAIARQLMSRLRQDKKELGMVVIDYLQLLRGGGRQENRQQEVSEISRGLKQLARELKVPVIALSQLSRASEDKSRTDNRPKLSDLRESGSLEQDADLVVLIHREGYYKPKDETLENKAQLIIAKQRQGPTGAVDVLFLRDITRFADEAAGADEPAEMQESQTHFN